MSELNIYQRINSVMVNNIYVKKGSAGQGTGVGYDDLISVLSPHLVKAGIVVTAEKDGESSSRENKKGSYIYQSDYLIHYINMDKPDDRFTTRIEAHAMDAGDKAPGKAITYATKTSMLKVFGIESGDNEESRAEQNDTDFITQEQQAEVYPLLCDANGMFTQKGTAACKAFKFNNIDEIKSKKFDQIIKMLSRK
jgi:hypothetical protein